MCKANYGEVGVFWDLWLEYCSSTPFMLVYKNMLSIFCTSFFKSELTVVFLSTQVI